MRVATFNIQHGATADGGAGRIEELVGACAALDADVLALQEVDRRVGRTGGVDQAAEIASALGATYTFGTTSRLDGGDYGNALVVRGELTKVQIVALERRARTEPRNAITAAVVVGGLELSVLATHLTTHNHLAHQQLIQCVDLLTNSPHPRVIMGDLNLPPGEVLPVTAAEGYRLVQSAPTYPNRRPRTQIDMVATTGLDVVDVDVVSTPVSDHRALVVELRPH